MNETITNSSGHELSQPSNSLLPTPNLTVDFYFLLDAVPDILCEPSQNTRSRAIYYFHSGPVLSPSLSSKLQAIASMTKDVPLHTSWPIHFYFDSAKYANNFYDVVVVEATVNDRFIGLINFPFRATLNHIIFPVKFVLSIRHYAIKVSEWSVSLWTLQLVHKNYMEARQQSRHHLTPKYSKYNFDVIHNHFHAIVIANPLTWRTNS